MLPVKWLDATWILHKYPEFTSHRVRTRGSRRWAGISSIIKHVRVRQTGNIGRPRRDSCCCKMRTWLISPRSLSHIGSATYHMSNYFRIKISSLLFSKIFLSLACSRGGRRHLWSLSACDQILSLGEQTWLFFDITKEFCPLVRLPQVRVTHE